jgi:hypothetical protein
MLTDSQELSGVEHLLEVVIKFGSLEKKIVGSPEVVAKEAVSFISSVVPQLQLASRLALSVDLTELASAVEGILAVTPEGVVVMVPAEKLTDRELILLHLARVRLAHMLGKSPSDLLQSSELVAAIKRTTGTVAGRLSELCGEGLAERKGKGEYHATTLGMHVFQHEVLPKLKAEGVR